MTLKSYNPLEANDSISIEVKIKSHDYSYKSEMDWIIDEDVLIDPNFFDTSLLRVSEKRSGEKYTIRVINFDDYEDYQFKAALYQIYVMQQIREKAM